MGNNTEKSVTLQFEFESTKGRILKESIEGTNTTEIYLKAEKRIDELELDLVGSETWYYTEII